jgi:integrase
MKSKLITDPAQLDQLWDEQFHQLNKEAPWAKRSLEIDAATLAKANEFGALLKADDRLLEVAKLYLEQSSSSAKTISKNNQFFKCLAGAIGNKSINQITKTDASNFLLQILLKLPKRYSDKYRGVPLVELAKRGFPTNERLSHKTINHHLLAVSSLFKWAEKHDKLKGKNPFQGLLLKVEKYDPDARSPFTQTELETFFSSPIYKGSNSSRRRTKPGEMVIKDSLYWLPLLGLFTGARLGELCQLYVADIRQDEGIWVFDINHSGEDKSLKTKSSKRLIPIHSKLISLGFLEHVQALKAEGHKRIFYDVSMGNINTYATVFSKRFATALNGIGIKHSKLCFHSFRHSFMDALRKVKFSDSIKHLLMGHKDTHISTVYGTGYSTAELKELVESINFSIGV